MQIAASRGAVSRARAGGAFAGHDRFRPLPGALLPAVIPLRGRIHRRDSYCRCRTSLSRRSSNPDNVGRLEAASIPSISSSGHILHPSGAGRVLPLPPRLAVGFGLKGYPTRLRRDSPLGTWFPRSQEGFGTLNWAVIPAQILTAASLYRPPMPLVNVLCSFFALSRNQRIDAVAPPSTWMVVPVMCRAGSDARKTTSAATSSAAPMCPRGMRLFSSAATSS